MRVDYGSQAAAADVVVERLGRRPFGLVPEFGAHPAGVHDPAITQIIKLIASDFVVVIRPSQRIESPQIGRAHV